MAGEPLTADSSDERAKILSQLDESVVTHVELDPDTYASSAEQFSGKYNDTFGILIVSVICASILVAAGMFAYGVSRKKNKTNDKGQDIEQQRTHDNMSVDIS